MLGCLKGVAIGDAIGKQTETLSPADITRWYPAGVRGFEGAAGEVIPRYVGNSKHEWRIGETTDDTERTIAVARAIIRERCGYTQFNLRIICGHKKIFFTSWHKSFSYLSTLRRADRNVLQIWIV